MRTALITGISGQDGSFLAEFLLEKGYEVHGIKRRSSSINTTRLDHIYDEPFADPKNLFLHYGDLTDFGSLQSVVKDVKPDEIYNLGAQSHVGVSFQLPVYTADVNALGTLRLLEILRLSGLADSCRYYQASSSEMFGEVAETPQTESTDLRPNSPYASAKVFAYWLTRNYRDSYGMHASNGILFNHESSRRGETFVTRKISVGVSELYFGLRNCLYLGNLEALRDWGHAKDYVEMQWMILQQDRPDDYVIATGYQFSVRNFLIWAFEVLEVQISFHGSGVNEIAVVEAIPNDPLCNMKLGDVVVRISEKYFRPNEVSSLLGDSAKARTKLGWVPRVSASELCSEMVLDDFKIAKGKKIMSMESL